MQPERQPFFHSLAFKTGVTIILIEVVILALTGAIYIHNFNQEIDQRIRASLLLPAALMNKGVLGMDAVTDNEQMSQLVGEDLINAFIVGINHNIFFALNSTYIGLRVEDVPGFDPGLLTGDISEQVVTQGKNGHYVAISPLFGADEQSIRFYLYLEAASDAAQAQKAVNVWLFLLGSLVTVLATSVVILIAFNATIFHPLQIILAVFRQVETGDLTARASPASARDEMGFVQRDLNRVVERLQQLFETLEQRVVERTRELAQSNEQLELEIAERRLAEQALREKEEQLRTLINAMPDIVVFKDGQGRYLEANDFDLRFFGLEGVDYRGKTDSELAEFTSFYRDALQGCKESDEAAWRAQTMCRADEIIPRPDGSTRVFDVIKLPTFHPDGSRKGLVVVGRDVTERKRVEEALREAHAGLERRVEERTAELRQANEELAQEIQERKRVEKDLRIAEEEKSLILNSTSDLVVYHATDMRILWANQVAADSANTTQDDLIGGCCWEIWHQRSEPCTGCPVLLARDTGRPQVAEISRPDGGKLFIRGYPLKDDQGRLVGMAEFCLDITERVRAELLNRTLFRITNAINTTANLDELYASIHDTLGAVIDTTNFYIALYDKATNSISFPYFEDEMDKDYAYIRDFTATNSLTGEVILSRAPLFLTQGMLLERAEKKQILGTVPKIWLGVPLIIKAEVIGVMAVQSYSDAERFEKADLAILNTVAGQIAIVIDRKRAEEEIRTLNQELEQRVFDRTAQFEAANKELEAFAYSVSHDLRAPLRHIDGFLELLQEKTTTTLDAQSQHYMANISDAAKRMGMLIDDLLSFSRMGRQGMSKALVDIGRLVREVIGELAPDVEGRNINWQIADIPKVRGDRAMLKIVLVNLISNALKFTRPRQQAEIQIGCILDLKTEITIFVRDNGVGFNMDYADKLFGVFQRLHRQDEFEGTGIGLANVRRIISRHGGRIWAEGKADGGATFYFSLPKPGKGD